ncbi:MAG: peptidylprolyl isomerase, partial [Oscillospiraceae bacterium]|nr:peptidylprolyl isomerase [Oscillospiraceae bacterium]
MVANQGYTYVDVNTMELVQLEEPEEGDPVAVINTTYGEFRAVLYPEYAPQTVENFIALAKSGYYDDTYVFEQKQDVYAAAGAP